MQSSQLHSVLLILLLASCAQPNHDDFARCLTEKGVEIYGTDRCSGCQTLHALFGESYTSLTYYECDPHTEKSDYARCAQMNITSLPTIILPSGERIVGVPTLEEISEKTGCPLR